MRVSTKRLGRFVYDIVADWHNHTWTPVFSRKYNNAIIDLLRNQLHDDVRMWYLGEILKQGKLVPFSLQSKRDILADITFRKFKGEFAYSPCEVCGTKEAPNAAHIVPREVGGVDNDSNLVHLCANHHYLFDRGLLTKQEFDSVKWGDKGVDSQWYITHVRIPQHRISWAKKG